MLANSNWTSGKSKDLFSRSPITAVRSNRSTAALCSKVVETVLWGNVEIVWDCRKNFPFDRRVEVLPPFVTQIKEGCFNGFNRFICFNFFLAENLSRTGNNR